MTGFRYTACCRSSEKKVVNSGMEFKQNGIYNHKDIRDDDEITEMTNEEKGKSLNKEVCKLQVAKVSLYVSAFALLASMSILIYLSVVLATRNNNTSKESADTDTRAVIFHEVCIDCMKLVKNPYKLSEADSLLDGLAKKEEDGVLKCCAKNATQMSSMFDALMREQFTLTDVIQESSKLQIPPEVPVDVKTASVSVHKHMTSEKIGVSTNKLNQTILMFNPHHINSSEHVRDVTVLENGLVIQHTGYYFIYGNVAYRIDTDIKMKLISTIYRTRPKSASSSVLLTTVHTSCDPFCSQDIESVFTGGVFFLKAGDFIQVFISQKQVVNFNKQSTYLGLVLLGRKTI